ncbi:RND efflux system, outer membrane lipoprotein, NodT family [Rhodopirellula maiorica SM1]|uniref:RND efflux system, outer membrane lipoprotein, NodT family n=1 Tax=Rhodopirellula maiorica SM1 TaxID=1265738 RepID=M5RSW5_9BACT|nr:TolC family protein [Rhodopirellula maiorica]EMI18482.1 RND efflux system, outer membrane lipoprotein, NodT family [Rhodopirellula maiorica SM1]
MGSFAFKLQRFLRKILAFSLLVVIGCAGRDSVPDFPTQSPPPFSQSGDLPVSERWWHEFGDPALDYHINQALESSFTLAAARQRLRAARAVARREASDLFPDVNGVADIGGTFGPGADLQNFVFGFEAAYPLDLWGQIESRVEAERLRAAATQQDYRTVALTLSAEITRTWFSLIEAHAQLGLLDEQIKTNRTGLLLQESRFGLGLIRSPDVLRQRQLVEATLEQEVVAKARIEVLEHQLAVLVGQMPQSAQYDPGTKLPALPPLPATGLPSELLQRRPDVRRDYLAFAAADHDLAAAISDQYPRLSLTGSLLNVADSPETIFRDWFVSIGGQLIAPLIDGGQRKAEVARTSAVVCELFNRYGQTMLIAFGEVEDSLARERYQIERLGHLEKQLELARQAADQLREQYLLEPDTDYLAVLTAITAQQRLQREMLAAQLELRLIRVTLYLALAGSFDPQPQNALDPAIILQPTVQQPADMNPANLIASETLDIGEADQGNIDFNYFDPKTDEAELDGLINEVSDLMFLETRDDE